MRSHTSRRSARAATVASLVGLLLATVGVPVGVSAAQPIAECTLPIGGDAGQINPHDYPRAIGTIKALMLFIDFPDAPATGSTAAAEANFLPDAPAWFADASYGKLDLVVTPVRRWIRMPHASTSYDFERDFTAESHAAYIADAVHAADPTVNFAGYQLYYFVANREATAISFSPAFVFGSSSDITADGATIGHGATFGADASDWGFKVLNHETGHDFGLPDLYNSEGGDEFADQHNFVGGWDVMGLISGHAPDLLAWEKYNLGWISSSQIACLNLAATTDVTLTPLETAGGVKAVVLRTGAKTVTVAEYRTAQGLDDAACATGILVSTVNNAIASGLGPIRLRDAHPGEVADGCELPLDDAPFTPDGPAFTDSASGITIRVLSLGDTARIRVTRSKAWTPPDIRNARSLTIRASALGTSERFFGALTASPAWTACRSAVAVQLQKFKAGAWVTVRTTTTTSTGGWSATITKSAGKYRALAAQVIVGSRPRHICLSRTSATVTVT